MAVREILLLGNPKLFEICEPVQEAALENIKPVVRDLHDTLMAFREKYDAGRAIAAPQIGFALQGRDEGMKRALLAKYGGNARTEAAVVNGLEWLARQQRPDGSWSLSGPYADGSTFENVEAATAMAMSGPNEKPIRPPAMKTLMARPRCPPLTAPTREAMSGWQRPERIPPATSATAKLA